MVITNISECKKNKSRVNVYVDDEFAFACYKDIAAEFRLSTGKTLTLELVDELLEKDGTLYAFQSAIRYISYQPRTQRDVVLHLRKRSIEDEYIENALSQLQEYGYIDDEDYAQQYAEELSQKFGQKMVYQKLRQKGIDGSLAQVAADAQNYQESLKQVMEQFSHRYINDPKEKQKEKLIRALMRRGFDYYDIESMMGGIYEE